MPIPIIDLFAGPGGLGEGFSSRLTDENTERVFDIKLSIEKDENAYKTLQLRSFFRKFPVGEAPTEYYDVLRAQSEKERELLIQELFDKYPEQAEEASEEAWCAELGSENFPPELVDQRIEDALGGERNWVLIGGPPCQAYSMAGRSRVGGIDKEDNRVYLYQEYLRIIAKHHPAVFVMENVKGLLSAEVNGEKVFDWIKKDLQDPNSIFGGLNSPTYKIFSLSHDPNDIDEDGNPIYNKDRDFLIKAENYGIPQKRHRIILLGIRADLENPEQILTPSANQIKLEEIINDLPKVRSGVGRRIIGVKKDGKKTRRIYRKEENTDRNWNLIVNNFRSEIIDWDGFAKEYSAKKIKTPVYGTGAEFIDFETPITTNPLKEWYSDPQGFKGACNHITRTHLIEDLKRYMFSSMFASIHDRFPRLREFEEHGEELLPDHKSAASGNFADRFRVQIKDSPATTVTSHISKDGHYFIHYDPEQCRSLTVREAARIQTFPDNYLFRGSRTAQYHQVGNAVPPYLAYQIAEIVEEIIYANNR